MASVLMILVVVVLIVLVAFLKLLEAVLIDVFILLTVTTSEILQAMLLFKNCTPYKCLLGIE